MISIIITHHKTPVLLKLCLKAIRENIGESEHEIIIADAEAKTEVSEQIKHQFPQVKIIAFNKNVGYAKLVNAGLATSRGEYVLILNSDILILKNSVSHLVNYLRDHSEAGLASPQLLTFSHQCQPSAFRFPRVKALLARRTFLGRLGWGKKELSRFEITTSPDQQTPQKADWVQGSAVMVRKSALDKVGNLDERFFMYFEDTDWCRRFWQNNLEVVFLPAARMSHYYYRHSKKWNSFGDLVFNKYTRCHIMSALKYFWKWRNNV